MWSSPSSFLYSCLHRILFEYGAPFLTSFSFSFLLVLIAVFTLCSSTWSPSPFLCSFLDRVLYHYRALIINIIHCFSLLYLPAFSYTNNRCTLYGSYTKFFFLSFLLFFFPFGSSFQPRSLRFLIQLLFWSFSTLFQFSTLFTSFPYWTSSRKRIDICDSVISSFPFSFHLSFLFCFHFHLHLFLLFSIAS